MVFFRGGARFSSLVLFSALMGTPARGSSSPDEAYAGDFPPDESTAEGNGGFVHFQLGLGFASATLPGAPGPIEEVSQNLYEVRLHLGLPFWASAGERPRECFEYVGSPGACGGFFTQSLAAFGAEVLYPSTVRIESGQASSLLRFFPHLVQSFSWPVSPTLVLEASGRLGWAYDKLQYGSTALVATAPKSMLSVRFAMPGLRFWGGVPGVAAQGTFLLPFFRYHTNKDETPLEVSGRNVTLLASSFADKGTGYRWGAAAGIDYSFSVGGSPLTASLLYEMERGRFRELRKTMGYRSGTTDGRHSVAGMHFVLARAL